MSLINKHKKKANKYEFYHDLANDESQPTCEKIAKLSGHDPQLRYVSLGIVDVVEPLKNEIVHSSSPPSK